MGTGSFSSIPSGGGGSKGTGLFKFLAADSSTSKHDKVQRLRKAAQASFEKVSSDKEFFSHFASPGVSTAYKAIFQLKFEALERGQWSSIAQMFNVDAGPGCLKRWVNAVLQTSTFANEQHRNFTKILLDSFLIRALDDKFDVFLNGDAAAVLKNLKRKTFDSISGNFLGIMLNESIKGQVPGLGVGDGEVVQGLAFEKADTIIESFEHEYRHKSLGEVKQVTYEDLFYVIAKEKAWFMKKVRKKMN